MAEVYLGLTDAMRQDTGLVGKQAELELVRFSCILVPQALNITHVVVSSYIQERKENRCEVDQE